MFNIVCYTEELSADIQSFFRKVFRENKRVVDFSNKDIDIINLSNEYMNEGCFWCAIDDNKKIVGTIALRPKENFYELRRFFVLKKYHNKGIGQKLLNSLIDFCMIKKIYIIKAATMEDGTSIHHILTKNGFKLTKRYSNSTADIFYKLKIDSMYIYHYELTKLKESFLHSLILNPTENIPMYKKEYRTDFFEGLYVSDRFKDVNDRVIFAGRNDYIRFFETIKEEWKTRLKAYDVDLKTLSGLNAHLVLFLCIVKNSNIVMLLPEECGGHFATTKILESFNVNVIHMIPDNNNKSVNVEKTIELIEEKHPNFIFVDRSEGLVYEDFSWLKKYNDIYKIFDASQYLVQILTGHYVNPFDMGFDMIVSTLHKNYPGPQKGIIAVKERSDIWNDYLLNAKTYISNTHPMAIAKSLMPLLSSREFIEYSELTIECVKKLEELLLNNNLPVIKRDTANPSTLHIWILCNTKEESYKYYLKLEQLHILTNYRLLPYNLGYGLRIGMSAAVRMGLRPCHIKELAAIMTEAYYDEISNKLIKKAEKLINKIIITGELSDKL
ncbi:MAG: GNAT family N-acetyltransferase [Clostridiales bacterium]|nr:GNAT family N-acetyltransferase [Clostridiales bacterium]